ncbi:CoA transferase subunit A [Hippea sp. KM1]|uniref:CoA transferase subunit A n=1 Tax=Hippea sp. KM1 TaxID=944481 RepID=UPI00046D032F|nr:CoA-transferase [Hippea sp. KM1]
MESIGELLGFRHPDEMREFFRNKSKKMESKLTSLEDAVDRFVKEGDYLAIGGFGLVRIPMAFLHEMIRQKKKGLKCAAFTSNLDTDMLAAGEMFDKTDVSYAIAFEALGIPKMIRRYFESGKVYTTEWSNGALGWRYKAAAMGLSYLPIRSMLGTDTQNYSAAKEITCPFTGMKYLAVPALYPDVAVIHVHAADIYGNSYIKGVLIADVDIAKASKKVIITAERIVPVDFFRDNPERTTIPFYLVDAVVKSPYGSYPANMPYEYFLDVDHLREMLDAFSTQEGLEDFLNKNIFQCKDFFDYINLHGGLKRIQHLIELENEILGGYNG